MKIMTMATRIGRAGIVAQSSWEGKMDCEDTWPGAPKTKTEVLARKHLALVAEKKNIMNTLIL